ncbi:MAG TPA: SAM-dependent methyltransferase [Candidatus Limnocylindria bacterium]|nr:SAM-dependent methyltransferase [Candidatus Limnocylindria bacterium]
MTTKSAADRLIPTQPTSGSVREPASFRDPIGFVYRRDGVLYRQISARHAADWQAFVGSGLFGQLVERGWLIEHDEAPRELAHDEDAWRVLRPRPLGFISYPYEWAFSQLKDAALLTLDVQSAALEAGMSLRDASAYNVQFDFSRPVMIDALSFEKRREGEPWVAYRQFCQHFLAPLALMALTDVRTSVLLRDFIDGVPLDLAARLLPASSRLRFGLAAHLHLHARAQGRRRGSAQPSAAGEDNGGGQRGRPRLAADRLEALIASLRAAVAGLHWRPAGTTWADYGDTTSYSSPAAASKREIVGRMLRATDGDWLWDLGANTGYFSRLAADMGRQVVALDADHGAAEQHYRAVRDDPALPRILPLVVDLTNPSPALGWAHAERQSLLGRANAQTLLALALVHHLAIGNNVPLERISELFAALGRELIVEFVPKSDRRVAEMLAWRQDVFGAYSLDGLRAAFDARWQLIADEQIEDSQRTLLHYRRR